MRTQFFYTRKDTTGEGPVVSRKDSFNLTAVIRSVEMADGTVLVLLNDIHERTTETPNISVKTNKMTGTIRKRDTFQSEIYLSKEDGERFFRASAVDEPLIIHTNTHVDNGVQAVAGE